MEPGKDIAGTSPPAPTCGGLHAPILQSLLHRLPAYQRYLPKIEIKSWFTSSEILADAIFVFEVQIS